MTTHPTDNDPSRVHARERPWFERVDEATLQAEIEAMSAPTITVAKQPDGTFAVLADHRIVSDRFVTNSSAWRAADRLASDDLSPAQRRSDYGLRKRIG